MKRFWVLIALFVFVGAAQCAGKKRTSSKKVAKTAKSKATKASKSAKWVGPPFGFYEVKVFNLEWETMADDTQATTLVWVESDFKGLRLYPNGTYKTNQSKSGKPEGRFTYDHKNKQLTFHEYRPHKREETGLFSDHFIPHKFPVEYVRHDAWEKPGHVIWWGHSNSLHNGQVWCKWVKP